MPKRYVAIKESLIQQGKSEKAAKTQAAKIFVGSGKTPAKRSALAKALHKD